VHGRIVAAGPRLIGRQRMLLRIRLGRYEFKFRRQCYILYADRRLRNLVVYFELCGKHSSGIHTLFQDQPVFAFYSLIVDVIHHLFYQMNSQTTDIYRI